MKARSANLADALDALDKKKVLAIDEVKASQKDWDQEFRSMAKMAVCFATEWEDCVGLKVVRELVKLPYPVCWFQCQLDDYGFVCFMASQKEEGDAIRVFSLDKAEDGPWALCAILSMEAAGFDVVAGQASDSNALANQARLLAAVLSAINCTNIKRVEHKAETSKQAVRRAMGRRPLFSYWTLEIDTSRQNPEIAALGGTHASPRLHLRRGHARQYAPGLWCWVNAHAVGNKHLGVVHKDYSIKRSDS